jgi:hypothetical protein
MNRASKDEPADDTSMTDEEMLREDLGDTSQQDDMADD